MGHDNVFTGEEIAGGGPADPAADVVAGVTVLAGLAMAAFSPDPKPTPAARASPTSATSSTSLASSSTDWTRSKKMLTG
jgi:hypothetical protein